MPDDQQRLLAAETGAAERETGLLPKSWQVPVLLLVGCNTLFMLWRLAPSAFESLTAAFGAKGRDILSPSVTSATCSLEGPSLGDIASPYYKKQEEWPDLCADAVEVISMCLTQVPICNPAKLQGSTNVRSTYRTASGSNEAQAYLSILENELLMAQLQSSSTCTQTEFTEALRQITEEVSMIQSLGAYFNGMSELLDGLGNQMNSEFETAFQLLLEESADVTTTTTASGHKALKILKKVTVVSLEVGVLVGTGMSLGGSDEEDASEASKTVKKVGDTMTAVCSEGQSIQTLSGQAASAFSSSSASSSSASSNAGETDDNNLDVLELDAASFTASVVQTLQDQMVATRQDLASNWGRLKQAMFTTRSCSLGAETIRLALQRSKPALEWAAISVLLPAKYVMYFQRAYAASKGTTLCQKVCDSAPLGCYSFKNIPFDYCAGSDIYKSEGFDVLRVLWMGQVGASDDMPPDSFWNFLIRKDGPVQNYINPVYGLSVTTAEELVMNVMQQCKYVQKTYVTDAGTVSGPSVQAMDCNVFGMPWPVHSFADCGPKGFVTGSYDEDYGCPIGYACTSSDGGCDIAAANFNSQILVPPARGHFSSLASQNKPSLVGCCQPFQSLQAMAADCDFAVCDCATLLAFRFKGNAAKDKTTGQHFNLDWLGACTTTLGNEQQKDIAAYDSNADLHLQTSLGVAWPDVFQNYDFIYQHVMSKVFAVGSDGVWMTSRQSMEADGYWLSLGKGSFLNVTLYQQTVFGIDSDMSLFKHDLTDMKNPVWKVASSGKISALQIHNGTAWAISEDGAVVTQKMSEMSETSAWTTASQGTITALQVLDNMIYGINSNLQVVSQSLDTMTVKSDWKTASAGSVFALQIVGGTIYGLGVDNCMYSQSLSTMTDTSPWKGPSQGSIMAFQIAGDSIYGLPVGGDGIYRQPLLHLMHGGSWQQFVTKSSLLAFAIPQNIPAGQATEAMRKDFRKELRSLEMGKAIAYAGKSYFEPTACSKHTQCTNSNDEAKCANGNNGVEWCDNSGCHPDCDYYDNIPYKCCHCGR